MGPGLALEQRGDEPPTRGRPPSGEPLKLRVVVYLTEPQLAALDAYVKRENSARSWVCVDALAHAGVIRHAERKR